MSVRHNNLPYLIWKYVKIAWKVFTCLTIVCILYWIGKYRGKQQALKQTNIFDKNIETPTKLTEVSY